MEIIVLVTDGVVETVYADGYIDPVVIYKDHDAVQEYGVMIPEACEIPIGNEVFDDIRRVKKERAYYKKE